MSAVAKIFAHPPKTILIGPGPTARSFPIQPTAAVWPMYFSTGVFLSVVLTAPIPLASNHPLAWLFWATVLGLTNTILSLFNHRSLPGFAYRKRRVFALILFYVGFTVFQAVPLPLFQGGLSVSLPNTVVTLPSLSIAPGASFIAAIRATSYLIFFWLALRVARNPTRARTMASVLLFGIAIHALVAILALKAFSDASFIAEKNAFFGMATGTFVNKNSFATFLGMGALLGFSLITSRPAAGHNSQRTVLQALLILATVTIIVALFLTQSRMGLMATLVGGSTMIFIQLNTFSKRLLSFLGLAIVVTIALNLGSAGQLERLRVDTLTRVELYQQIANMILARPLTGFGAGSFPLAFELYHSAPVTAGFVWDHAHSTYLSLWVQSGIIFGTLPMLAGGIVARQLWQRSNQPHFGQPLALAGLGALVLGAVHSLADFSLEIQANAFLILALIALGLGPATKLKERQ